LPNSGRIFGKKTTGITIIKGPKSGFAYDWVTYFAISLTFLQKLKIVAIVKLLKLLAGFGLGTVNSCHCGLGFFIIICSIFERIRVGNCERRLIGPS
jgi:hypothetical protein